MRPGPRHVELVLACAGCGEPTLVLGVVEPCPCGSHSLRFPGPARKKTPKTPRARARPKSAPEPAEHVRRRDEYPFNR